MPLDTTRSDSALQLAPTGFHGDQILRRLIDSLLLRAEAFIETGANVGSTTVDVARSRQGIPIFTCEPDEVAYEHLLTNTAEFQAVDARRVQSPSFLYTLIEQQQHLTDLCALFWLDAHGYGYHWPLVDEVAFITKRFDRAIILIDDVRVPSHPQFGYDEYNGQVCEPDLFCPAIAPLRNAKLLLPTYTEHTSTHHPLRGVAGIEYGSGWTLPDALGGQFDVLDPGVFA